MNPHLRARKGCGSVPTPRVGRWCLILIVLLMMIAPAKRACAADLVVGLSRVNHILVLMQENHSFDNYLGTLPYAAGGPYHAPAKAGGPCPSDDHLCADGLTCTPDAHGGLSCANSNPAASGGKFFVFHETNYCTGNPPHEWVEAHREANFEDPNSPIVLGDGFARVKQSNMTAMGYYTQPDLPYYYALAETFAISDAHFTSMVGPTMPNRAYLMAAMLFGHVLTSSANDTPLAKSGHRPITGGFIVRALTGTAGPVR